MSKKKLRSLLRKAWYASFNATGEGWNGEYPFGQPGGATSVKRRQLAAEWRAWLKQSKALEEGDDE